MAFKTESAIWDHFSKEKAAGVAKCTLCSKELKWNGSTTSNLWNHLRLYHSSVISSSEDLKPIVRRAASLPSSSTTQLRLDGCFGKPSRCSVARALRITNLLVEWCARNIRPLCVVNDEGLKALLLFLEPHFKVPSRTHLQSVLRRKHALAREAVQRELISVPGLSITTDLRTSRASQGYASFTVHYINEEWNLASCLLETAYMPEEHTAVNIVAKTLTCLEKFNVPATKMISLVHDQASNMKAASRKLQDEIKGFEGILCAAHRLQTCVTHALSAPAVSSLLSACRKLVGHFRHSTKATHALLAQQKKPENESVKSSKCRWKPKRLIQDCCTRWNSQLMMMERLLELHLPIVGVLNDVTVSKLSDAALDLTPEQWYLAKELVAVLTPVSTTTTYWSGESYVTISSIHPMVAGWKETMKVDVGDSEALCAVKKEFAAQLESRFPVSPKSLAVQAAAIDPRFRKLVFLDATQREAACLKRLTCRRNILQ